MIYRCEDVNCSTLQNPSIYKYKFEQNKTQSDFLRKRHIFIIFLIFWPIGKNIINAQNMRILK